MISPPRYCEHDAGIEGFWDGGLYLVTDAKPMFNLTWTFLWSLVRLRLGNPKRADGFKLMIVDYNMRANYD